MENLNLGYIIMSIMILIPVIAMMFISKKDVEEYKKTSQTRIAKKIKPSLDS